MPTKDLILNGRKARGIEDATTAPTTPTAPVAKTPKGFVPEKIDGTINDSQLKKWQALNAPDPNEGENTLRDYLNQINAPTAQEEEAERKKARSRAIIGGVSDMAVAVSNLINANKGGVAMPQSNLAGMYSGKWQERKKEIDALRNKKMRGQLQLADMREKRKAREQQSKIAQQQMGIELAKLQIEIDKAKQDGDIKKAQALKATYDALLSKSKAENEATYGGKLMEANIKAKNASATSSYASANASNANARKTNQEADIEAKKQKMKIGLGNGGTVELDANALNDVEVGRLFGMLPDDVKKEYGQTVTEGLAGEKIVSKNPTRQQMLAAIGANVPNNANLQAELKRMAGVRTPLPAGNYVEKPKDKDYFQQYLKTGATDFSIYKQKK